MTGVPFKGSSNRVYPPLLPVRNSSAPKYLVTSSHQSSAVRNVDTKYPCHKIPSTPVTSLEQPHKLMPTSPERSARRPVSYAESRFMTTIPSSPRPSGGRGRARLPG
ncbi:hypothetical protein M405DRAFT_220474 [Rhizopogon salebrosus TDB-379]|nr:hypothetical protein M405DRAFT_220474 [Rhizopogon salebrosus TDB-379]